MRLLFSLSNLLFLPLLLAGNVYISARAAEKVFESPDSIKAAKTYSILTFDKADSVVCPKGTKSVRFNSAGTKLYTMNLEDMSIYEFEEVTRRITRKFIFKATKALGWDYKLNKPMASFAEKPVEACFSHDNKILWVSLHNSAGIIPLMPDSLIHDSSLNSKEIYLLNVQNNRQDTINIPFIKTGRTPKIIARTADNKTLLVSNWHSETISVLRINDTVAPFGKLIATIPVPATPRGIAIDDKKKKSYITLMGGNYITVINNKTWKIERNIKVNYSPRHILVDTRGRLFVSFNLLAEVACIDPRTGRSLFKIATNKQPRTIVLSKNQKFLFVTCYTGNMVDVFKINSNSFTRIYSIYCSGKPIGIDLYEDRDKLEAWVCTNTAGNLKIFSFNKAY
jgi:DNA-binding beta-propeller fold protein YncE